MSARALPCTPVGCSINWLLLQFSPFTLSLYLKPFCEVTFIGTRLPLPQIKIANKKTNNNTGNEATFFSLFRLQHTAHSCIFCSVHRDQAKQIQRKFANLSATWLSAIAIHRSPSRSPSTFAISYGRIVIKQSRFSCKPIINSNCNAKHEEKLNSQNYE